MDKWEYGEKYGFNKEVEEPGVTILKEEIEKLETIKN